MTLAPSKLSHPVENTFMGGNILPNNAMMGRPLSPRIALGEKEDVTFRILCPKDKIGSIIGKGGSIVRSIRDETGAKISIDVSSDVGDERVVRVSAPEVRWKHYLCCINKLCQISRNDVCFLSCIGARGSFLQGTKGSHDHS